MPVTARRSLGHILAQPTTDNSAANNPTTNNPAKGLLTTQLSMKVSFGLASTNNGYQIKSSVSNMTITISDNKSTSHT